MDTGAAELLAVTVPAMFPLLLALMPFPRVPVPADIVQVCVMMMSPDGCGAVFKSNVTTIFLLGFHNMNRFKILLFLLLLIMYCVTVCGNLLIILLVSFSKPLHSPMYFFLTQLSITDIMVTTDISPYMLNIVLYERASISFHSCIVQLYFFAMSETAECLLLTVMSYDRYLAICCPLRYSSIMNQRLYVGFVFASWLLSCSVTFYITFETCKLNFCGPNTIDHFFCDFSPLLGLSCSDASRLLMESTLLCNAVIVLPFFLIVVSYTYIISAIVKISSFSGRQKSFSTCSSHLTVVFLFYGTLIAMYAIPNGAKSQTVSKTMAILYAVLTPFLNPFIYSLRNNDIKKALRSLVDKKRE
ncbi:olfactory receptor 1M1-like [Hyperolius riggenbachi]|uniref:olfactory receptor 1M1-like n=1 Tax=Hyperolius riggenbachi TaxID=752182 RepID=UPI0035A29F67